MNDMAFDLLRAELRDYYSLRTPQKLGGSNYRPPNFDRLDEYAADHPELNSYQLKAVQYEIIADCFQPVIFNNSPFYAETGMRLPLYNGRWNSSGCWLRERNEHLFKETDPNGYEQYVAGKKHGIHIVESYPDHDHHCFPFSNVIANGLGKIYEQAQAELNRAQDQEECDFLESSMRGLKSMKKISEKFAAAATALYSRNNDRGQHRFLKMIAKTAQEVPWRKPGTFYEGLAAIWFLHEVSNCMEGIGFSVISHLDRTLEDLYQHDLSTGRITPEDAYDLICRFLMHTDAKLDYSQPINKAYYAQEQGETLILGGCDQNGKPICNDLTFLVLKAYRELDLINPKILCRISHDSDQALLDAINEHFLRGKNILALLSDDAIIPMQVREGKRLEDARCYVAGGCWEPIVEGCEHAAGANYYLYLPRLLDMSIHKHPEIEAETGIVCEKIDRATNFEAVYQIIMSNVFQSIRQTAGRIGKYGRIWPQVNPSPFFSACLADCLKNRKDYTGGGGRYNPHAILISSFAIFVDSLLAIKALCFGSGNHSLRTLLEAVRADWVGHEALRAEALAAPYFGDDRPESNALAKRILSDINECIRDLKNERGGPFVLSIINYSESLPFAKMTLATPNGRRAGEYLTQGLTPSRNHPNSNLTSVINSCSSLNLCNVSTSSVLTISLPITGISPAILASLERVYASSGIAVLQLNCVDKAVLLDARQHPERHQDLVVRLFGYSTRFVNLTAEFQDEFISRGIYS